jgi:hypothetical protein
MQILNGRDAGCSLGSSHTWVTEQQRTAGKSGWPREVARRIIRCERVRHWVHNGVQGLKSAHF